MTNQNTRSRSRKSSAASTRKSLKQSSASLKRRSASKNPSPSINKCPICLEPLGKKNIVSTECKHTFHKKCLQMSCQAKEICPLCRKNITHTCKKIKPFNSDDIFLYVPWYQKIDPKNKEKVNEIINHPEFDPNVIGEGNRPLVSILIEQHEKRVLDELLEKKGKKLKVDDDIINDLIANKQTYYIELLKKNNKIPKKFNKVIRELL